jgi:hypothetical protein
MGGMPTASVVLEAMAVQAAVKKLGDTLQAGVAAGEAVQASVCLLKPSWDIREGSRI